MGSPHHGCVHFLGRLLPCKYLDIYKNILSSWNEVMVIAEFFFLRQPLWLSEYTTQSSTPFEVSSKLCYAKKASELFNAFYMIMTWFISQHKKWVSKFISCLLMNITRKVKMCFSLVLLLPKYHIFFWAQQKAFQNPIFLHMEGLWDTLNYIVRPKPNCSSWILPSLTTCSQRSKVSCRKYVI